MNKLKKLFTFGDSYMYGTELPQAVIPDFDKLLETKLKKPGLIGPDGRVPFGVSNEEIRNAAHSLERDNVKNYEQLAHSLSMSGIVHDHYNFDEYHNLAWGGNSYAAIMTTLLNNIEQIDSESIVIVGATYPLRTSRFTVKKNDNIGPSMLENHNNYSHVTKNESHNTYVELSLEFSDDLLVEYINAMTYILAIDSMLEKSGCKYIIIDPLNILRESSELDGKIRKGWRFTDNIRRVLENNDEWDAIRQVKLIYNVQQKLNNYLFDYTLHHSIYALTQMDEITHCVLGHPNARCHKHFAETYLIPYIDKLND